MTDEEASKIKYDQNAHIPDEVLNPPKNTVEQPGFTQSSNIVQDGNFLRALSAAPTDVPKDALDHIRVYGESLYIYDWKNARWLEFGASATSANRVDHGNTGSNETIDFSAGKVHAMTLNADCTLNFSNPVAGGRYLLEIKQDSIGGRTVSFPSNVQWSGGTPPILTPNAGQTDIITLYYNGTNYAGAYTLNYTI